MKPITEPIEQFDGGTAIDDSADRRYRRWEIGFYVFAAALITAVGLCAEMRSY